MKHLIILFLFFCFTSRAQSSDTTQVTKEDKAARVPSDTNIRVRLTEPELGEIVAKEEITISMKIGIDEFGNVVSVKNQSKTRCSDPLILDRVLSAFYKVKYCPKPGAPIEYLYFRLIFHKMSDEE